MLDYKLFSQGMVRLNNFFVKNDTSELFLKDYYKAIQELTAEQFNRGISFLIKNHQSHFFPIPSELFKAVQETRESVTVTEESKQIEPKYISCPQEIKEKIKSILDIKKRKVSV